MNRTLIVLYNNSMNSRTCSKCKIDKEVSEFRKRGKRYTSHCKECLKKAYRENTSGSYSKQYCLDKNKRHKKLIHDFIIQYLESHSCVDCGESNIVVLDFDHIDPSAKYTEISDMVQRSISIPRIKSEIEKCQVRCGNCHRRKTITNNFGDLNGKL